MPYKRTTRFFALAGFSLLVMFLFVTLSGFVKKGPPVEYESPWLTIAPGAMLVVNHPLEIQPRAISIMVKQLILGPESIDTVRPHTELLDHPLYVQDMTPLNILIYNNSHESYYIRVYLK